MAYISLNPTKTSVVNTAYPNDPSSDWDSFLRVGRFDGDYWRSLLQFDLSAFNNRTITGALLRLWQEEIGDPTGTLAFNAHCIDEDWTELTVTWDTQPTYTLNSPVSLSLSSNTEGWRDFYVTSLIQDIIHNGRTYYGILLRQPGSTDNVAKHFDISKINIWLTVWYKSSFRPNVEGVWKDNANTYVNVDGVWKTGDVYENVDGIWKPST